MGGSPTCDFHRARSSSRHTRRWSGLLSAVHDIGVLASLYACEDEVIVLPRNPGSDQFAPVGLTLENAQPALACPPCRLQLPQARAYRSAHCDALLAIM